MAAPILAAVLAVFLALTFAAWRRYLRVTAEARREPLDTCPFGLTETFGDSHLSTVPHQQGVRWLHEIFDRSARRYPEHTALQIPRTGESLSFRELAKRADAVAAAVSKHLTAPDQVVAVDIEQDGCDIVACHLGILKAGGAAVFLDATLPDSLRRHMLDDARPVLVLARGAQRYRDLPTLDVPGLPEATSPHVPPPWLDDPRERLATIFYTSGTTGKPKGVECPHAGYVNLALSYADYFDLVAGMDATSLTSSLGYDGSISEMYSAWVSGCAVVLLTKEALRSGPDLVPVLCDAEVTVLFCPPVLLTTLSANPELDLPYPLCRYVVPAGEAFPPALVEPWTRGRRQIVNTYGPTEASTDTSRQSLRPGEPVTIGSPLANVRYVILEVGGTRPLAHGETGELCIGGVHVARGYRNLPELTARKFVKHPRFGRLYRTGDRCRIDARTQRVHFLGRVDTQLKVRGHRVETQPVEDLLQSQFREIDAAVLDYQNEELVALVAAPSLRDPGSPAVAPAPADWATRVTQRLAQQLPEPSVPSRILLVEAFAMKPVSGKIDRDRLPRLADLRTAQGTATAAEIAPDDAANGSDGEAVLAICREVLESPLGRDDAFADHGGHSIAIARLAHHLRSAGWSIAVRALLEDCSTPRKVAEQPRGLPGTPTPPATGSDLSSAGCGPGDESAARVMHVALFTSAQVLFLGLLHAPLLAGFVALLGNAGIGHLFTDARLVELLLAGLLAYAAALALPFASLAWVMLIKRVMGGDFHRNDVTPGWYPKWSRMHLRIWCIGRLETSVLLPLRTLYRSAPLMAFVLRRLGAQAGANLQCAHDAEISGPLDLLTFGDDVAVQTGAYLHASRWVDQRLRVGPIRLEDGCTIGMRAGVADHTTVGRGSWITPFTPILADVGPHEMWEGAPARFAGRTTKLNRPSRHCRPRLPVWLLESVSVLAQGLLEVGLLVVPTAFVTWWAATWMLTGATGVTSGGIPLLELAARIGAYGIIATWLSLVLTSLLSGLFLRFTPASPGLHPTRGPGSALLLYRAKKMDQLQRLWSWSITGQYLRALAGVRFSRVGGSECDAMLNLVPEATHADALVFWSSGCFTNMLDHRAEHVVLRPLDMPAHFFAGNNCVAESGQLPSNFLLGVSTPGNDIRFRRQMHARLAEPAAVAGNPPIRFGRRAHEGEPAESKAPGFLLFLTRVSLNDVLAIGILPTADVLVYAVVYTLLVQVGTEPVVGAPVALILTELGLILACIGIKKVLVGRWGTAHSAPFWSLRHFTYFFAQDCYAAWCRSALGILSGTVLPNVVLRRLGCRIGKRTIVASPLQVADWNASAFGDDCIVDGLLQFHTFEDMVLRVKRSEIHDGSCVSFGATVMGGAVLRPETTLLPLSMALKEMHLPSGIHHGSPAEPLSLAKPARPGGSPR